MKIKKGYIKNNWPVIILVLIVIALAVTSRDFLISVLAGVFLITMVIRYRKYDEMEQEIDDWWRGLPKEEKQKYYFACHAEKGLG